VRCSEEAGSSGNGGAVLDGLGDDDEDSDEIMSPHESEDDENEGNKKIARRQFPKFNEKLRPEDVKLVTGLLFTNKKQLKKAVQTYKIQNGHSLMVTKSDKQRYQVHCIGEGGTWSIWASACSNGHSFQIKTIQGTHNCLRFNFEKGTRNYNVDWLTETCIETFRIQLHMTPRVLKAMVDQEARRKAIANIVGDYKEQFHMLYDYCLKLTTKNPNSTAIASIKKNENDEDEFAGIYICLGQLKRGI